MNRYFIWTILSVCVFGCKTRPQLNRDLLVTEICNSFKSDTVVASDSAKASRILRSYLEPLAKNIPRDSAEDLYMFVYARLFKECDEFAILCDRLFRTVKNSDWKFLDIEPETKLVILMLINFSRSETSNTLVLTMIP